MLKVYDLLCIFAQYTSNIVFQQYFCAYSPHSYIAVQLRKNPSVFNHVHKLKVFLGKRSTEFIRLTLQILYCRVRLPARYPLDRDSFMFISVQLQYFHTVFDLKCYISYSLNVKTSYE